MDYTVIISAIVLGLSVLAAARGSSTGFSTPIPRRWCARCAGCCCCW